MSEFTEETGFDGYEPVSVDPGPSVLIATIIFCVLSLAILPCLISVRKQFKRRRGENNEESRSGGGGTVKDNEPHQETPPDSVTPPPVASKQLNGGRPPADDASVESGSSVVQNVWNAILDGNPRSGPNPSRTRANMTKYHEKLRAQDPSSSLNLTTLLGGVVVANNNDHSSRKNNNNDNQSVGASVLSKLDHDEVSIRDAVDAIDDDRAPAAVTKADGRITTPVDNDNNNNGNSSCFGCGRGPVTQIFDALLEIAEWDYETKRIYRLATPFVLREFFKGTLEIANVAIIARFIGTGDVSAYVTVDMVVGLSAAVFSGFYESLATLCSQAIGARNKRLAGQYVQISMVLYVISYSPFIVLWMMYMDETLRWFGFDEYTVQTGTDFSRIFLFVQVIKAVSEAIHALLDTIGKESYSGTYFVLKEAVKTAGVVAVGLSPDASLERVGLVYLFAEAAGLFLNVLIVMWNGWFDQYLGGIIGSCALGNRKALKLMSTAAASLSLGYLLSYSEWEFLALTAKTLGPAEVTAWGILGTLWDIVEFVSEAVADAAEVRCAMLLGAGRPERARLSAYKSIYLATFVSMFISSCVFIVGDYIPIWITNDATLQRMIADLIPLFGVGNIALTIGTIAWTIVGSQGRFRLSTAVGFMGSWFVTMPLSLVCTVGFNWDLQGQTAAVVVGYMVSGTVNSYLLFTSDWQQLSRKVIEANADANSDSSSSGSSVDEEVSSGQPNPVLNKTSLLDNSRVRSTVPNESSGKDSLYGMNVQIEK